MIEDSHSSLHLIINLPAKLVILYMYGESRQMDEMKCVNGVETTTIDNECKAKLKRKFKLNSTDQVQRISINTLCDPMDFGAKNLGFDLISTPCVHPKQLRT